MTDDDLFPFARRALGSAIVTGASGAGLALSFARPAAADALERAYEAATQVRKAARENGREGVRAALDAGRPAIQSAFEAKDRLRRRAVGALPPTLAESVEGWRSQFIEGEKLAYYGGVRLARDLQPAGDLAMARSKSVLAEAVLAFGDVAEVALANSIKFGEELQKGELNIPSSPRPAAKKGRALGGARKSARRKR